MPRPVLLLASLALAQSAHATSPEAWLEGELHARFNAVSQWEIREIRPSVGGSGLTIEHFELGVVGARTLVVLHGKATNGRPVTEQRWYAVSGLAPAVVATRSMAARTTITPEMLEVAPVDVLAQGCTPLTDPAKAVGRRLLQRRNPGAPLCALMLKPVPAVQRGSNVTVSVRVGAVALRTEAIARADAEVGEQVSLFRASDQVTFSGIVSAPGEVQIK